jgi:type IV pilus assembly protein PilM
VFGFGKKPGPTLGLDINSSTISIIQIEKSKTDSKVTRFSSLPTPPDIVREGLLSDPEAVGSAVRELLDLIGIPNKKPVPLLNIGIPGQAVVIRLMPVPTGMPPDELSDVVQQEAINNLPFPLDEANIDYCLLPATERTDPDGVRRVDVLLAAIQRIVVESYWRMAEAANVELGRLDISSLAVIRSLAASGTLKDDGQMTMAVNIRNDATDITLIKKGMPLFSRSVLLGVETLGEAISRSIDAPMDEALSLLPKIQLGSVPTSDPRTGQAAQVARSVFGDLTAEVGRSLEFYMSQVGAVQVDQVILSGPGCVVPGIHEFVSNRLNITTTVADPFQNLIYDKAQVLDERRAVHAMLVGLVSDGASGAVPSVEVNLNKQGRSTLSEGGGGEDGEEGEEEEEVDTPWFVPTLAGGVALCLISGLVWAALSFYFTNGKATELAELESQIESAKHQVEVMEKAQGELASLRDKKNVLERIVKHGEPRSVIVKVLKDAIPPGVQVISMTVNDTEVKLNCQSIDFAKASHFAINLQGSNMLEDVKLGNVKRLKKNPAAIAFQVAAAVNPDAASINPDDYKLPPAPAEGLADGTNGQQGMKFASITGGSVRTSGNQRPALYYFFSPKNPVCKAFQPQFEIAKKKYQSQADFNVIDFDDLSNAEMVDKFKVKSSPDIVFVDNRGKSSHLTGQTPMLAIDAAFEGLKVATPGKTN